MAGYSGTPLAKKLCIKPGHRVVLGGTKHGTRLVDNKTCAIDEVWSGLRFVRRLRDR